MLHTGMIWQKIHRQNNEISAANSPLFVHDSAQVAKTAHIRAFEVVSKRAIYVYMGKSAIKFSCVYRRNITYIKCLFLLEKNIYRRRGCVLTPKMHEMKNEGRCKDATQKNV